MKVTGYLLREKVREWELRRNMANEQFPASLKKFPGETKRTPAEVVGDFEKAEKAIAYLQAAQARYNLGVQVNVLGEVMTLCEAVKRIGGAGRAEALWRSAAGGKKDRYSSYRNDDEVRKADEVRAVATITQEDAAKQATRAAKYAGAMRAAIATGNATVVEMELDTAIIE